MRLPVSLHLATLILLLPNAYIFVNTQGAASKALDVIKAALEAAANPNGTLAETTTRDPRLTGDPRKDYKLDPNLPRELGGYDLSYYPFYVAVPTDITFTCEGRLDGYYASVPHFCQLFHLCVHSHRHDFLCANYTVFDQSQFICHFANSVNCSNSENYYERNNELYVTTTTTKLPPLSEYDDYEEEARPARRRPKRPRGGRKGGRRRRPRTTTTVSPDDYYYDDYEEDITNAPAEKPSYRKWNPGTTLEPTEPPVAARKVRPPRPITRAPPKADPVAEESLDYPAEDAPLAVEPLPVTDEVAPPPQQPEAPRRRAGDLAPRTRPPPPHDAPLIEEEEPATTLPSAARGRPAGAASPREAEEEPQPARRRPAERRPVKEEHLSARQPAKTHALHSEEEAVADELPMEATEGQAQTDEAPRRRGAGSKTHVRQRAPPAASVEPEEPAARKRPSAPAANQRAAPPPAARRPSAADEHSERAPAAARRPSAVADVHPVAGRRPTVAADSGDVAPVRGRRPAAHHHAETAAELPATHEEDPSAVEEHIQEEAPRRRAGPRRGQRATTLRELRRPVRAPPAEPPPEDEHLEANVSGDVPVGPAAPLDPQTVINGILSGVGAKAAAAQRTYRPPTTKKGQLEETTTPGPVDPTNIVNSILSGAAPSAPRVAPSVRIVTTPKSSENAGAVTPRVTNAGAAVRRGASKHSASGTEALRAAADIAEVRLGETLAATTESVVPATTKPASGETTEAAAPAGGRRRVVQRRKKTTTTTTTAAPANAEYEYVE